MCHCLSALGQAVPPSQSHQWPLGASRALLLRGLRSSGTPAPLKHTCSTEDVPLLVRFGTSSAPQPEPSLALRSVKSTASARTPKQWHTCLSNATVSGKTTLMVQALGVSTPVLYPPASPAIFEVPTGGITARRSLETGSRNVWAGFLLPPA